MDKELLKIAVQLANTQLITNAIASSGNKATIPTLTNPNAVMDLVVTYYQRLIAIKQWSPLQLLNPLLQAVLCYRQ